MRLSLDPKGGITPVVNEKQLDVMAFDFMANNPYDVQTFLAHVIIAISQATATVKKVGYINKSRE